MSERLWTGLVALGIVSALFTCAGVGLLIVSTAGSDSVAGSGRQAAVAAPIKKKSKEWTFQDIQDHLAANGIKTSRGAGRMGSKVGMWYGPGDGKPLDDDRGLMEMLEHGNSSIKQDDENPAKTVNAQVYFFRKGYFFVEPEQDPERAVKNYADIKQRKVGIAFGQYVIYGSDEKLAELKRLLP